MESGGTFEGADRGVGEVVTRGGREVVAAGARVGPEGERGAREVG